MRLPTLAIVAFGHGAQRGIAWYEYAQTGVVRRLRSRDGWGKAWDPRMTRPLIAKPARIVTAAIPHEARRSLADADRFAAWMAARTGYPIIDACMRALHRSG